MQIYFRIEHILWSLNDSDTINQKILSMCPTFQFNLHTRNKYKINNRKIQSKVNTTKLTSYMAQTR